MESIYRDDFMHARRSSRGISLLREPLRQDVSTIAADQPVYLQQGSVFTNETRNQQNPIKTVHMYSCATGSENFTLQQENTSKSYKDSYSNSGNEIGRRARKDNLISDNSFGRSFSQPFKRSDNFTDWEYLERNVMFHRSFSQPQSTSADNFEINKAIHEELMNSPWGTYRRTPKRRDRYAMYIPDSGNFDHEYPENDEARFVQQGINGYGRTNANKYEYTENAYATHRRAPRSYPRLDVDSDENRNGPQVTRDTRRDGVVFTNLCKIPNCVTHTENNSFVNNNNIHDKIAKQPSVQHLFSIKLTDVKQLNAPETDATGILSDNSGKLNKIENNLTERTSVKEIFKTKKSDRRNMVASEGQNTPKKTPFFYCRWVAEYPKTLFLLTLGGHILIALITVILLLSGYDLFPTEFEFLPMYDLQVPWLKRDFAWRFRNEYKERYVRKWYIQGLNKWYRSMAYNRGNIALHYDTGGKNIFTREHLKQIEGVEKEIANMHNYTNYCVQTALLKCQKLTSVLRYFDGTYAGIDPVFNDTDYNNIAEVLYIATTNNKTKGDFAYFLSKNHRITKQYAYADKTRTRVPIGFPIKLGQKQEEMEDEMEDFLVANFKPLIEKLKKNVRGLEITYWSFLLFKHDIVIQIFYDLIFAVGSILFIFGFIVYHTKSLWISIFAVSSILTSFLCTNIIYRVILDFRYFGFFHVITLFIILGIGADDLFVFLDVWKNTGFETYPSLAHRLSSAYKKSMKSMFFTSLTTTVAFFVSSFSPLIATKSFGVFAGLLVVVNYISVVVYFPTVVVLHHLYFKTWTWPCFSYISEKIKGFKDETNNSKENCSDDIKQTQSNVQSIFEDNHAVGTAGNRYNVVGKVNPSFTPELEDEYGFIKFKAGTASALTVIDKAVINERVPSETDETSDASWNISDGKKQKKVLVRFFRDYYFKFVTHWLIKWIILIILTVLVMFFMYCVSTIETENEPAQFYRNSHNYGKALDLDFHGFVANKNDRNVVVYIVWGLKEQDMSGCHFSDARCVGVARFDPTFDPNTVQAQLAIKRFCDRLLDFNDHDIEQFKIRRDFTTGKPEIRCFARDLDRYFRIESVRSGDNFTLPWDYRKAISFMQSKSLIYNTLKFNSSFPNVYEIPISYWLNDGFRFQNKEVFEKYQYLIGEGTSYYSTPMKTDFSVFYGNRIVYLGVEVNLTLGRFSSGYPEGKPVMDRWETFVQDELSRMPPGMQNGFQLTKDYWHNLSVQKTIEDGAIIGIVVGILFAFPILTFATQNILIGFFATLSICCSTICVVGIIPLAGCKLGLLESLNMCMVVGLTVDYVVHLAEGYHLSKRRDRKSRVQDMLEVMGISVFSGACTTLGASVFMFFAQIQFIIRFGMFMFSTIGFSLLYSLGFFTTIMGILGPSGNTCDVKAIGRYVTSKCRALLHRS